MNTKTEIITQVQESEKSILYKDVIYNYFDEGLTRKVYTNPDKTKVIKIPKTLQYCHYNESEAQTYKDVQEQHRDKMALTEIDENGIVVQEFVEPIKFSEKSMTIPQILFAGHCRDEVGWNSEGELVCFDLDEYMKY